MNEVLTFKDFVKRYRLGFFEKRKFAKFIDTLGMGWYDSVLWKPESWEKYYMKFRSNNCHESDK